MRRYAHIGRVSALLACAAMLAPPTSLNAAEPVRAAGGGLRNPAATGVRNPRGPTQIVDVSLDPQGSLHGNAVDQDGQPLVQQAVFLDNGREQFAAETDEAGRFRFDGLQGGSYAVAAGGQKQMCRAWKAGTAPPAAKRQVVLTGYCDSAGASCGEPVGCGTPVGCAAPMGKMRQALHDPIIVGGILAAAIAIPLAIDDDGENPAS